MADNGAVDVDELSEGCMILAVAPGGRGWTDVFNGGDVSHPVARMRAYIDILRLVWRYFIDDVPAEYTGQFYKFASPLFNPVGRKCCPSSLAGHHHQARPRPDRSIKFMRCRRGGRTQRCSSHIPLDDLFNPDFRSPSRHRLSLVKEHRYGTTVSTKDVANGPADPHAVRSLCR
ncbi:MAG: LLM class flavin-dependent oxidoreductase [Mycobacterium sp.]|nr:LLM class flavin-dependent oxidoreductase [Mycobacterium sp.]